MRPVYRAAGRSRLGGIPELRGVGELLGEDGVIIDGSLCGCSTPTVTPDADLLRERLAYPEVRNGEAAPVASDLVLGWWRRSHRAGRCSERLERLDRPLRETRLVHGRARLPG